MGFELYVSKAMYRLKNATNKSRMNEKFLNGECAK